MVPWRGSQALHHYTTRSSKYYPTCFQMSPSSLLPLHDFSKLASPEKKSGCFPRISSQPQAGLKTSCLTSSLCGVRPPRPRWSEAELDPEDKTCLQHFHICIESLEGLVGSEGTSGRGFTFSPRANVYRNDYKGRERIAPSAYPLPLQLLQTSYEIHRVFCREV